MERKNVLGVTRRRGGAREVTYNRSGAKLSDWKTQFPHPVPNPHPLAASDLGRLLFSRRMSKLDSPIIDHRHPRRRIASCDPTLFRCRIGPEIVGV